LAISSLLLIEISSKTLKNSLQVGKVGEMDENLFNFFFQRILKGSNASNTQLPDLLS